MPEEKKKERKLSVAVPSVAKLRLLFERGFRSSTASSRPSSSRSVKTAKDEPVQNNAEPVQATPVEPVTIAEPAQLEITATEPKDTPEPQTENLQVSESTALVEPAPAIDENTESVSVETAPAVEEHTEEVPAEESPPTTEAETSTPSASAATDEHITIESIKPATDEPVTSNDNIAPQAPEAPATQTSEETATEAPTDKEDVFTPSASEPVTKDETAQTIASNEQSIEVKVTENSSEPSDMKAADSTASPEMPIEAAVEPTVNEPIKEDVAVVAEVRTADVEAKEES